MLEFALLGLLSFPVELTPLPPTGGFAANPVGEPVAMGFQDSRGSEESNEPGDDEGEEFDAEKDYDRRSRRAAPRDSFEVFDHPEMLSAEEAEDLKIVRPDDIVLGVAHNGEAKAYPLSVMGSHELGNDTVGGLPIAPSW